MIRSHAVSLALSLGSLLLVRSAEVRAENSAPPPAQPPRAPNARHVHAPLPGSDGVYGRFDGSLALSASAGAELEATQPRGVLKLSAHYLWTAGVYARYSDAFGGGERRPLRVASLGLDVRPLFLPRFALDSERGPAFWDLTLDSFSLNAGAYFAQPRRRDFGDERGFEAGLGFGLPLLAAAKGPWLEARAERRFADHGENAWLFTLSIAYHTLAWTNDTEE